MSAIFLMGSMIAVLIFVDDRGSTYTIPRDSESNPSVMDVGIKENMSVFHDERQMLQPSSSQQTIPNYNGNKTQTDNITSDEIIASQSCSWKPDASVLLCVVQALGWVGVCAQSFFWTSWRGEEVGCIDLALQSVVGMATAALLPLANAYFGAASVWCGSELFFHLLMMSVGFVSNSDGSSTQWWTSHGNAPRFIGALSGINYAVHATNGLIVATDIISDPNRRARTVAMVNNTLPMGQLVTALSGGAIAQYFGGFEYVFVCYGFLGALVTSAVWAISARQSLFSRQSGGEEECFQFDSEREPPETS